MQLPRGTFLEIKKAELIFSILDELERKKFSGICSISSGTVSGTLVFKSGKCILAKILNKTGDGAWDELQKMSGHEVDAALSSLDEAQIQLALEFNKPCRIIKAGKTAPAAAAHPEPAGKPIAPPRTAAPVKPAAVPQKPAPVASPTPRPSSSFTAPPAVAPSKPVAPPSPARTAAPPQPAVQVKPAAQPPAQPLTAPSKPVTPPSPARTAAPRQPAVPVKPAAQPPAQPLTAQKPAAPSYATPQIPVHHPQEPKKPAETEEPPQESSSFEKDIDTFDTLDLDNVTDKIRNDCKTMIKQLQLEHLMER